MAEAFVCDYSKAIAEALHEKDEKPPQLKPKEERLEDAYRALCYDEPRVDSDASCFLLAQSLASKHGWALSERLVEGIRQGTSKYQVTKKGDAGHPSDAGIAEEEEELTFQNTASATPAGFASCAVAAFLQVPLNCCLASTKTEVETWLGSYRGPDKLADIEKRMKMLQIDNVDEALDKSNRAHLNEDPTKNIEPWERQEQDEDDEVWADESDPSDFVYESDAIDWTAWEDPSFDPKQLSQPMTGSWDDLRRAVGNLLQELSFAKFAALSKVQMKKLQVSDLLTQLTLTLLVQRGSCPLMEDDGMRTYGTLPLHVFQDGILSGKTDLLPDYLALVQSLIAVDAAATNLTPGIAPATTVGLVSLSKFTSHAKSLKETRKIRKCVLECLEDIGSVIEKSKYSDHRITWALLPLLDIISNRTMDGSILDPSFHDRLTNADAQCLLNSGFFRELILLYCKSQDDSPANTLARKSLLQSIQLLCLESMTLLGKYAWRVPELSKAIHSDDFRVLHNFDSLIWYIMGIQLASAGSTLRMKNAQVVTVDSCRKGYQKGWYCLKSQVVTAIDKIRELRERKEEAKETVWRESILDLQRFTNLLQSSSTLGSIWKMETNKEDLDAWLLPLRSALSVMPAVEPSIDKLSDANGTKSSDNDKVGSPSERPPASYEEDLANVRKSIKVLSLFLENTDRHGGLSSKTD